MTGPNPVDRGKTGSKIHVLSDRTGLPLSVAVSAANTNDAYALKPLVMAIPAIKSQRCPRRRKPTKLHADKAYDQADLRAWVRDQDRDLLACDAADDRGDAVRPSNCAGSSVARGRGRTGCRRGAGGVNTSENRCVQGTVLPMRSPNSKTARR